MLITFLVFATITIIFLFVALFILYPVILFSLSTNCAATSTKYIKVQSSVLKFYL